MGGLAMNSKAFEEVMNRFRSLTFNENFEMIVAVANGGIIPAAIINQRLNVEFKLIKINYRDSNQQPIYDMPKLVADIDFDCRNKTILLVEDRIKTGASIKMAMSLLQDAAVIKTFAVNGSADYVLYDEACFKFPWII